MKRVYTNKESERFIQHRIVAEGCKNGGQKKMQIQKEKEKIDQK